MVMSNNSLKSRPVCNKKGSSAVFLTVILAAIMSITLALIYAVKEEAIKSSADAVINLAGDSVMSEFNLELNEEYGLFLIKGNDDELSKKLYRYVSYSLNDMENAKLQSVKASGSRFSVTDISLVKEQIIEHMKVVEVAGLIEKDGLKGNNDMNERVLRYGPAIASLPSAAVPKQSLTAKAEALADKGDEVDEVFKSGTENYLLNRYIIRTFNSRVSAVNRQHFFKNEVEYILGGETSDLKNEKRVEMALKAMRIPINMAYLYSDPEKQAALAAAAQALTPGAAAAATQAALTATWAYAESDNDVELLWQGKKVPMVKDSSTWAIDLDTAIEGVFGGTVSPTNEKGYDYEEYLQILLFFQDDNIKTARIMDLIQVNMRAEHDGDFLISEYSAGIWMKVRINGREYEYEKKY